MDQQLNPTLKEQELNNTTKIEIPVPVELTYKGSQRKIPGHQLFTWYPSTGEIKVTNTKAESELVPKSVTGKTNQVITRHKVNQEAGAVYVQALNKENAAKKVLKIIAQVRLNQLTNKTT